MISFNIRNAWLINFAKKLSDEAYKNFKLILPLTSVGLDQLHLDLIVLATWLAVRRFANIPHGKADIYHENCSTLLYKNNWAISCVLSSLCPLSFDSLRIRKGEINILKSFGRILEHNWPFLPVNNLAMRWADLWCCGESLKSINIFSGSTSRCIWFFRFQKSILVSLLWPSSRT